MSERLQNAIVLLAAVAAAAGTARLGAWQLDRARQKIALQQAIVERGHRPPLPESGLPRDPSEVPPLEHRQVRVRGQWVARSAVFLDNRQMGHEVGFFVVVPLRLADGTAVVVQRGFVPRDAADRSRLPPLAPQPGTIDVLGRIAAGPSRLFEFGDAAPERIRQNLDLPSYAIETGLVLRPVTLIEEADSPAAAADGLKRDWPLPAVDVSRHYGYAFQWFALSALVTGLYVWFRILRPRRLRAA